MMRERLRLCHVDLAAGEIDGARLAAVATAGFGTVLTSTPFAHTGADRLVLDFRAAWHGGDAIGELRTLARRCAAYDLALGIDLRIDRVAGGNPLTADLGLPALREYRDELPDPRRAPHIALAERLVYVGTVGERLVQRWCDLLDTWLDAGVRVFRAVAVDAAPASVWAAMIAHAKQRATDAVFVAWTAGGTAGCIDALAPAHFDAITCSAPWWNFRDDWLPSEIGRIDALGTRLIVPLDDTANSVVPGESDRRGRAARRLLHFAAACADGLLAPHDWFERWGGEAADELRTEFVAAATRLAHRPIPLSRRLARLSGDAAAITALRFDLADDSPRLLLANPSLDRGAGAAACTWTHSLDGVRLESTERGESYGPADWIALAPGECVELTLAQTRPVAATAARSKRALERATRRPRIAIDIVSPTVDNGRFAVKRIVGDSVHVEADVFADGHDYLAVALLWRPCDRDEWNEVRMRALGNDRWAAEFPLERLGRHVFTIEAWRDDFATLRHDLEVKRAAGQNLANELEEGRELLSYAADRATTSIAAQLHAIADALVDEDGIDVLVGAEMAELMTAADPRAFVTRWEYEQPVEAERAIAGCAAWYELFPRSQGKPGRHGTFDDVIEQLPRIAAMGFDVLYLTPIHPIGRSHRKGRNNTPRAESGDPGSPYAIGAVDGGHESVHPELGTLADFRRLADAAARHGMEIALDFAIQCSPDHPWLNEHPGWFRHRADGSIRYAENPPKKYEDIVNVDFYAEAAVPALWLALRDIVRHWIANGVHLFRADNPHTKPFPFWEWLIAAIRAEHPEVVFLSEAFTRPKPMYRLAKLGFSQSYTYFTWRNGKHELIEYLRELSVAPVADFFRPHFFVNTPDINPGFLQHSGRPGFLIRAALAATLSGLWGMCSGFELCESSALPGKEEYLDSEKYELRHRDWNAPGNIVAEIALLNRIRRTNPALRSQRGVTFHNAFDDQVLWFEKATPARDNVLLVAICLDPHTAHTFDVELPLWGWGLSDDGVLAIEDLVVGTRFVLRGKRQTLRLEPGLPFAIWRAAPEVNA